METTRDASVESNMTDLSPLSESSRSADSFSSFECIIASTEEKQQDVETLTILLNHLDQSDETTHDKEVKQGVATYLIQQLHNALRRTNTLYRDRLGRSRALRVSLLISALEMVLRCSGSTMYKFIEIMPIETLPTIVILVEIFDAEKQSVIRDVVLQKVARILNRLCTHGIPIRIVVIEALFLLLKGPTDTRIDAACALASLAARRGDKLHPCTIPRIVKFSPSLISTLSIAASSLPEEQVESILDAILNLASSSNDVVVNIAQRFGTLRVFNQSMKSTIPEVRRNSYMIASSLLRCSAGFTELFAVQPVNGKILLQGLAKAAMNEEEPELQHFVTCIMTKTLANMNGSLEHLEIITDALALVASAAEQDRTAHEAAVALCNKAPVLGSSANQEKVCVNLAELAQSSSKFIRTIAWKTLLKLSLCPINRRFLVAQESFQRAIVSNLRDRRREDDASMAIAVLEKVSCEQRNREAICQSPILKHLVDVVTNNETMNRIDYMAGVKSIILLMSDDSTINHFLPYTNLLPWLATLANSNTSSKKLKQDTIQAMVRLTSQLLEV